MTPSEIHRDMILINQSCKGESFWKVFNPDSGAQSNTVSLVLDPERKWKCLLSHLYFLTRV